MIARFENRVAEKVFRNQRTASGYPSLRLKNGYSQDDALDIEDARKFKISHNPLSLRIDRALPGGIR